MLILSWTINHGENKLTDNFELFTDEQELQEYMVNKTSIFKDAHCWAVSKVIEASEPHLVEGAA